MASSASGVTGAGWPRRRPRSTSGRATTTCRRGRRTARSSHSPRTGPGEFEVFVVPQRRWRGAEPEPEPGRRRRVGTRSTGRRAGRRSSIRRRASSPRRRTRSFARGLARRGSWSSRRSSLAGWSSPGGAARCRSGRTWSLSPSRRAPATVISDEFRFIPAAVAAGVFADRGRLEVAAGSQSCWRCAGRVPGARVVLCLLLRRRSP